MNLIVTILDASVKNEEKCSDACFNAAAQAIATDIFPLFCVLTNELVNEFNTIEKGDLIFDNNNDAEMLIEPISRIISKYYDQFR